MSTVKGRLIVTGLVVAVLVGLIVTFVQVRSSRPGPTPTGGRVNSARVGEPGLGELRWPNGWRREAAQEGDDRAGVLLRLRRSDPEATFLLRRITGKLQDPFNVEDLARESERALEEGVQDFAAIENRHFTRDGLQVVSIDYVQGPSATLFRARLLVVPTRDRTFYLTFRVPASGYGEVEREFKQLTDSFFQAL